MHEGSWVLVTLSTKADVTIIEAFKFMEKVKDLINEQKNVQRDPAIF